MSLTKLFREFVIVLSRLAARGVVGGEHGAEPVVLRLRGRMVDNGGGWRKPSVDRGANHLGTIGASADDRRNVSGGIWCLVPGQ